jgi:hypothetical protein
MPEDAAATKGGGGSSGGGGDGGTHRELVWTENSKAMFDACCASTPWLVRHFTRSGFARGLAARGCGTVTEQNMFDVARDVTPPAHLEKTLGILNKLRTTDAG